MTRFTFPFLERHTQIFLWLMVLIVILIVDPRSFFAVGGRWYPVSVYICPLRALFPGPSFVFPPCGRRWRRGITRKLQWTRLLFYNGQYSKIVLSFIKIAHADADLNWTITRTISFTTNTYCTWGQNAIRHEWRVKLVLILSGTMSIMYLVGKDNGHVDCWVNGDQQRRVDQLYKC